jgi:serine/threonine protein kinase
MSLTAGTRLGHYEIVARIGAGGMGQVYEARDPRLNRTVAIKALPDHVSSLPEARARFEREAQLIAGLNDPHISTLHDVGPTHRHGVRRRGRCVNGRVVRPRMVISFIADGRRCP